MGTTAILFDLDDTLVLDGEAATQAFLATCARAHERYGVDVVALHETVRRQARGFWHASRTAAYARALGMSSWEGLWARFLGDDPRLAALREWAPEYRRRAWNRALEEHGIRNPAFAEELAEIFGAERRARHALFPDVEDVLKEVHGKYELALVTNGLADHQQEKLCGAGLADHFDVVVISGEIGAAKPDRRIFNHALRRLGAPPQEAVMVGNSLQRDIVGAQAAGIRGVWLNRQRKDCEGDVTPDVQIATLKELTCVIE
ncbi:MAG TPA: HAD family hydrolase [Candidatus Hydrogenedentes bacterium]|nr:HAD family hydrolase [Candidatus Hydrogenedentota bacterium]